MSLLFRRTRALEAQIDQFLDAVSEGCLAFEQGVDDYLRGDQASFEERRRLFHLPRSSWTDYDEDLISEGGGIFPRTSKSIPLSEQVPEWLLDALLGLVVARACHPVWR